MIESELDFFHMNAIAIWYSRGEVIVSDVDADDDGETSSKPCITKSQLPCWRGHAAGEMG